MRPSNSCFHDQIPLQLFQVLPITLTKENRSLLTQHFDQVQSDYSCYSQLFLVRKDKHGLWKKKKKNNTIKKNHPGPSKALPWFPDALLFQLGLIKAPYVSNPSTSGVIQIAPEHQKACQTTQA